MNIQTPPVYRSRFHVQVDGYDCSSSFSSISWQGEDLFLASVVCEKAKSARDLIHKESTVHIQVWNDKSEIVKRWKAEFERVSFRAFDRLDVGDSGVLFQIVILHKVTLTEATDQEERQVRPTELPRPVERPARKATRRSA